MGMPDMQSDNELTDNHEAELLKKLEQEFGPPVNNAVPPAPKPFVAVASKTDNAPQIPKDIAPMPPAKKPHRRWKLAMIGIALLAVVSGVFLTRNSASSPLSVILGKPKFTLKYDSPVGLLPPFQKESIRSGKFRLTGTYIDRLSVDRTGNFSVDAKGNVSFEMLKDVATVNNLITYLDTKNDPKAPVILADRNFRYDFQSILGYQYLYSRPDRIFGGFVPAAEGKAPANDLTINNGANCNASLSSLKTSTTGTMLNTVNLAPVTMKQGSKTTVMLNPQTIQKADQSVNSFFENCFAFPDRGLVEYGEFQKQLKSRHTTQPSVTYWQDTKNKDHWHLQVDAHNFGGKLAFEVWDLKTSGSKLPGTTGSYQELTNSYGLAYSTCRVVPVALSDFAAAYDYQFIAEDN
jgi:hypothetical protein